MSEARFTIKQIEAALRAGRGIYQYSAAAMIKVCGRPISRNGIKNYCLRHPKLMKLREGLLEEVVDVAEATIFKAARNGNITAAIFILKCQGKSRGWIERVSIEGSNGPPLQIAEAPPVDLRNLDDEKRVQRYRETLAAYGAGTPQP